MSEIINEIVAAETNEKTKIDFADGLPDRLATYVHRMAASASLPVPELTETQRLIRGIMFRRGDVWRVLRRHRVNFDGATYCLFKRYEFHSGRNVNLYGVMSTVGIPDADKIDTVAMLLSGLITGRWSQGTERWERALGLK
jgi:hypothetical protein